MQSEGGGVELRERGREQEQRLVACGGHVHGRGNIPGKIENPTHARLDAKRTLPGV